MKFILGKKLEMTQIFKEDGTVVPVTAILAEPNVVAQIKTQAADKYSAVQIGFGRAKKMNKPQTGHFKDIEAKAKTRELRVDAEEIGELKRGDLITVGAFENGDKVKVSGVSKGKGFQGVVKRHGFHGSAKTHGHKDQERMPGSIGATDAARVFKGKRMAGHMGDEKVTVSGLEIVEIDIEKNILYVKGAVPGARNGAILIYGPGEMKLNVKPEIPEVIEEKIEEVKTEEVKEEVKIEDKAEEIIPEIQEEIKTEANQE